MGDFLKAHLLIGRKPKPGELWKFGHGDEGPWPTADTMLAEIIDVKDGWVRYKEGLRQDERKTMRIFLWYYNFHKERV